MSEELEKLIKENEELKQTVKELKNELIQANYNIRELLNGRRYYTGFGE